MTPLERARVTIRIATSLEGRVKKDLLEATLDPVERNEMLAGVLGLVLRRTSRSIPIPVDREEWLTHIVRMAVEP